MSRCIDADTLEEILEKIPAADIKNMGGQAYVLVKLSQVFNVIDNQPTIEPEPHWIPCCERLPKKSGQYYVTGGDKVWICEFLIIPNFTGGWCNDVANPVVQAWMPIELPEPYREGEEQE